MKCPVCVKNGEKSTLHGGLGMSTLLYCPPFYDEEGIYHNHDSNTTTYDYRCSNGHEFIVSGRKACPSYPENCDYSGSEEIRVIEPEDFEL